MFPCRRLAPARSSPCQAHPPHDARSEFRSELPVRSCSGRPRTCFPCVHARVSSTSISLSSSLTSTLSSRISRALVQVRPWSCPAARRCSPRKTALGRPSGFSALVCCDLQLPLSSPAEASSLLGFARHMLPAEPLHPILAAKVLPLRPAICSMECLAVCRICAVPARCHKFRSLSMPCIVRLT